jgi:hypothetical protein
MRKLHTILIALALTVAAMATAVDQVGGLSFLGAPRQSGGGLVTWSPIANSDESNCGVYL